MTTNELDSVHRRLLGWRKGIADLERLSFAASQGSHAFLPGMLPKLWHHHPCFYESRLYREAFYRGFYSAACWFLIQRLASVGAAVKPVSSMFDWYDREHDDSVLKCVPKPE